MGLIVGFDTATADTAVAVLDGGQPIAGRTVAPSERGRPRHSAALLPEIERAVSEAGGWRRVDRIAVGVGPGSFTGLRIGVATAKALSAGTGIAISPVCTLDALARGIGLAAPDRPRLAVLDARRREVFFALYDETGCRVWEPGVCGPIALVERLAALPSPPLVAGDGSLRFRNELRDGGADIPDDADPLHRVSARHVCALGAGIDPADPTPIYLRQPDAERWRERDGA